MAGSCFLCGFSRTIGFDFCAAKGWGKAGEAVDCTLLELALEDLF